MRQGWVLAVGIAGLVLSACASSEGGTACSEANPCGEGFECVGEVCVQAPDSGGGVDARPGFIDAGPWIDAGPESDARPLAGFGEPCTDKLDCASKICIFVNTGGICTETCVGGTCPDEFGCFGVFGAIDPGAIADVCVPESNQLCSPCVMDTECSIIGMDKCLSYENGKTFCGRDCDAVGCPSGYSCSRVDVGGAELSQCVPNSGACDCNAALLDTTETCEIITPLAACGGIRTCSGAAGWGGCEPPSASDVPDSSFADDNCDGIDGDYDGGIFVSKDSGDDDDSCGLDHSDPCATIGHGLIRAIISGRNFVYVQASASDYNEIVSMVVGKHIYGGYDVNWERGPYTEAAHRVRIVGGLDGAEDQYLTIKAHGLIAPTTLADLYILGARANGSTSSGARGSYAVHVDNANLNLERVTIVGAAGASGGGGSAGLPSRSAGYSTVMRGGRGGGAAQMADTCDTKKSGAGGSAGNNTCSGGRNPDGGRGGAGGAIDTSCKFGQCAVSGNCNAKSGSAGAVASYATGVYGRAGGGGAGADTCGEGGGGGRGRIENGAAGARGTRGGFLSGGYWYARSGGQGGLGQHGSGGGGGGGSGGCDKGIDSYGAGGGGGGAGGCAATSGGGSGLGGGGSFGIFAVNGAVLTATACSIQRGNGGDGGQGGPGGHGQVGAPAGDRGTAGDDSKRGGLGGTGGHGGHGGGGGGGAGGVSAGAYYSGSTVTVSCGMSGGSDGDGGPGGISAPNAPASTDDGIDGRAGQSGGVVSIYRCINGSGC